MDERDTGTGFVEVSPIEAESPTLVEGLPGLGLVASIAVDQLTRQLGLDYHGHIRCEGLPPVVSYNDGRVRDLVRVYAGTDPAVLTLQSDLMVPQDAFDSVTTCVLHDLADRFDRAVFLAGAPAGSEEEVGQVSGVATTDALEADLEGAGITLAEGSGLIGGVTGALLDGCYRHEVPAAVLIVRAHPAIPDPGAARAVIEQALEPLLGIDVDTTELQEQSDRIQERLQQIAQQYQSAMEGESTPQQPTGPSMYQ